MFESFFAKFVETLASKTLDSVFGKQVSHGDWQVPEIGSILTPDTVRTAIGKHHDRISSWASDVHFYKMAEPEATEAVTLSLDLTRSIRRFRSRSERSGSAPPKREFTEEALLIGRDHYLLIGDPGAGKTTTFKRLVGRLLTSPESPADVWGVPIVIVLREHATEHSVCDVVLQALGLQAPVDRLLHDSTFGPGDSDPGLGPPDAVEALYGPLRYQLVASLLDSLGAVLLLDGLDEVTLEARQDLERSIEVLSQHMRSSKLIASCRSGDLPFLDGFSVAEICELTPAQVMNVAARWLGEPRSKRFLDAIRRGNAAELANRPLFLCQMLAIFKTTDRIPDQPSTLCREMVRLVLQEWDYQRRFIRGSRYKEFDTDSKLEFLTNLAFLVTFGLKTKHFEHDNLVQAYEFLCSNFGLPSGEANQVAREIETHTGIIVALESHGFEFAHLSIQEYLAAEHIARLPDPSVLRDLYARNAEVMAVAVTRSSDPSRFLGVLTNEMPLEIDEATQRRFLTRLLQERPRLAATEYLGLAVVNLTSRAKRGQQDVLLDFMADKAVATAFVNLTGFAYTPEEMVLAKAVEYHVKPYCGVGSYRLPERFIASRAMLDAITTGLESSDPLPNELRTWPGVRQESTFL